MTHSPHLRARRLAVAVLLGAMLLGSVVALLPARSGAEEARAVPAPALDPSSSASSEVAVVAGGCFWGVQGVFQHVSGVSNAVSGYAGGDKASAEYEIVSGGRTGHAESVQDTVDPRQRSYGRILDIY